MDLLGTALDLIYPRQCVICANSTAAHPRYFCWECWREIALIHPPFCAQCGDPVDGAVEGPYRCHACAGDGQAFIRARSAARYRGPLATALQVFKYGKATYLADDLCDLLEGCYRTHYADCRLDGVIPVPLYPRKQRERTYNQSALLAAVLARRIGVPLWRRTLQRVRYTSTQTTLAAAQRRRNVADAFAVPARARAWLRNKTCLLIDDVMTTGATVDACARTLVEAGAWRVLVLTVGRG